VKLRLPIPALAVFSIFISFPAQAAKGPIIQVEGEKVFSARRVVSYLALPDTLPDWSPQDWGSWAEDAAFMTTEAYRDMGYFESQVEVLFPSGDTISMGTPKIILVQVQEGLRYRFGQIEIRMPMGKYPPFEISRLRAHSGRFFEKAHLFRDRRDLLKFYGNGGFLKTQVAESLFYDTASKAVHVVYRVDPGLALVLDTLILHIQREGDSTNRPGKTSPELLRSLFPLQRKDTLALKDISTYERKLKSTRGFNFVRVRDSLLPDAEGRSALVLNAEEKMPGELDLAGVWETQYGFGGSVSWSHANLAGRLQEGKLGFSFAERKQSLFLGYASPLLFGSSIRFDNDFVVNWYQDGRLVQDSGWFRGDFDILNQSKLSRQLSLWSRFVTGAELFGKSEKVDSVNRLRDFNLNFLNTLFLYRLDDMVNPTRGARLSLTWGNGGPLLRDGEVSVLQRRHNWFEAQSSSYLPFGHFLVLALRLDGGRFFGAGGINSERFFLGGPRSVRSRDWRQVCPELDTVCVKEGIEPAYFLTSGEARIQPFQPNWIAADGKLRHLLGLQFVPFVDYGNVWQPGQNLAESGRGLAVGIGLRYVFLALFNIRLDYAWDPRNSSEKRWILDLGQAY